MIPNSIYSKKINNFSEDGGRIVLSKEENRSCKLIVKSVETDDSVEWKFSIQSQQNRTIKINSHHVEVRYNGKYSISSLNLKNTLRKLTQMALRLFS